MLRADKMKGARCMPKIHPTALVDASAELADDVEIGPFCVVDRDVKLGPGAVLREGVTIRRYTSLGEGNFVDAWTVLGGEPQDLKFHASTVSYLEIGDHNVFREHVTISRATAPGGKTIIGNHGYWMVGAHAGHEAVVGDYCILINGAKLAGHTRLGKRCVLSAGAVVHQYCRVGDGAMFQGNSATSQHVPPFVTCISVNNVVGLNMVGMRRWPGMTSEDRAQVKEAFHIFYRGGKGAADALREMDARTDWGAAAASFREFVREALTAEPPYARGLVGMWGRRTMRTAD